MDGNYPHIFLQSGSFFLAIFEFSILHSPGEHRAMGTHGPLSIALGCLWTRLHLEVLFQVKWLLAEL